MATTYAVPGARGARRDGTPAGHRLSLAHLTVAAIAAGVGAVAGLSPLLAVFAVVAIPVMALTFADMAAGLAIFAIAASLEALPGLGSGITAAKLMGLLLVASWLVSVVLRREGRPVFFTERLAMTFLVAAFLIWGATTLLWAENPRGGAGNLSRFALNAALFPVVYAAIRQRHDMIVVVTAIVSATVLAAGWGFAYPSSGDRLGGGAGNPNVLGLFLIIGICLAAAMAATRTLGVYPRVLAFGAMAFGTVALFATGSRGALVGLTAALLVTIFSGGRRRIGRSVVMAMIIVALAGTYYSTLAPPEVRDRVERVGEDSGSGRVTLWTVGGRMIEDSPVGGVGIGQFRQSLPEYGLRPGYLQQTNFIFDDLKVAHSFYLQIWTELGTVGLALFLGLLACAFHAAISARREFRRLGDHQLELIARGLIAALSGVLAAGLFSSQIYSKMFWLILALTVALAGLAGRDRGPAPTSGSRAAVQK